MKRHHEKAFDKVNQLTHRSVIAEYQKTPANKEIADAIMNPYSNEWTRLADELNLRSVFSLLLQGIKGLDSEYNYSVAIRTLHYKLAEIAAELELPDELITKMIEH